jgi:hypothetical protein
MLRSMGMPFPPPEWNIAADTRLPMAPCRAPAAVSCAGTDLFRPGKVKDYRSGKREHEHEVMAMMAKKLSDDDIALVSGYFSSIAVTVKAP